MIKKCIHAMAVAMVARVVWWYGIRTVLIEKRQSSPTMYRAAVFEHVPQGDVKSETYREIIDKNLKIYEKAVEIAYQNDVELLVFPEDSLINSEKYNRSMLIEHILEPMPDPRNGQLVNFCETTSLDKKKTSVLATISCWAIQYKMFIALEFGDKVKCDKNIESECPPDGHYLFNTIALFDWYGNLVAKYHKMQLYYEFQYNIPTKKTENNDPVVYYDSPFGRIGFMICFDLMYKQPGIKLVEEYGVQTIIFSTYWFNHLPFVSSVQMQQAFALAHNINFICANTHIPKTGTLGSGIYSGKFGAIIYTNNPDSNSKLAIATIPIDLRSKESTFEVHKTKPKLFVVFRNKTRQELQNNYLNPNDLQSIILLNFHQNLTGSVKWCFPGSHLCCRLYYELKHISQDEKAIFALVTGASLSGAIGQSRYPIFQEYCGMVQCESKNCSQFSSNNGIEFNYIFLSTTSMSHYVYPSVIGNNQRLLPIRKEWIYQRLEPDENIIRVRPTQPIVAVTLYGRNYDNDPVYVH